MKLVPRYYQADAVADCWDYLASGKGVAPLLVEPTGSGKALIISMLAEGANQFDPSVRVLIITDSRELVRQNYAEFVGLWPEAPAGVYSAGLNRRDINARILFAGIQSIYKRGFQLQKCDILIIDECHMIPFASDAMYQQLIKDLRICNPGMVVIGLTATAYRGNGVPLAGQDGSLFDGIAHETTAAELITEGYLCPPVSSRRGLIDTKGIATRAGDYATNQAEARAMCPETIEAMVNQIVEAGQGKVAWKIFGVSTAHCEALHDALNARGYHGDCVFGHTDSQRGKGTRDRIIADFDRGDMRYLVSNMTLIKGFNVKRIDLIVLAYITKSIVKYVQSIGRGTRVLYAPGYDLETREGRLEAIANGPKPYVQVLDFGNNITRCGPFDDPFLKDKRGAGGGDAPFKVCPECEAECATATRACAVCGFEFPPPEQKINVVPDEKPILSNTQSAWITVDEVLYYVHEKEGKPKSLRVEYRCGLTFHKEWVCFDHGGYARTKAEGWWIRRAGSPVPANTHEAYDLAMMGVVPSPVGIMLRKNGKYDEIAGYQFPPRVQGMAA